MYVCVCVGEKGLGVGGEVPISEGSIKPIKHNIIYHSATCILFINVGHKIRMHFPLYFDDFVIC